MAAITGEFRPAGGHSGHRRLSQMSAGLARIAPDGETLIEEEGIALIHRHLRVDGPEPAGAIRCPEGVAITLAGRVDNREELTRALALRLRCDASRILIEVYKAWGIAGFARVVGDFALALWDRPNRRMVLATDGMGRHALYYTWREQSLYWCTLARPLRDAVHPSSPPSLEYAADFLTNRVPASGPFESIEAVSGGTAYVVDAAGARSVRYWSFDPGKEIRYRTDEEYEEHFRDVFTEAVRCRSGGEHPVFCELSGGVDSSSIVCAAASLAQSGRIAEPPRAVCYTFPASATADEGEYVREVERATGVLTARLSDVDYPCLTPAAPDLQWDIPSNAIWVLNRYDGVARLMWAHQSTVLLSGVGGDQMFWSEFHPGLPLADLVGRGRLARAVRESFAIARRDRRSAAEVFWHGVGPALPRWWQSRLATYGAPGEWFTPRFVRDTGLRDRQLHAPDDVGFPLPTSAMQYGLIRRSMRPFALDPCLSERWIEMRYPYLDRRVAEFALALPFDQKVRDGVGRSIVRRGLAGMVPDRILYRQTKAGPGEAFLRAFIRAWRWMAPLFDEPILAQLGIVDPIRLRAALGAARHGMARQTAQLTWTISLELWLRHVLAATDAIGGRPSRRDVSPPTRSVGGGGGATASRRRAEPDDELTYAISSRAETPRRPAGGISEPGGTP